jgi:hypothetical protein
VVSSQLPGRKQVRLVAHLAPKEGGFLTGKCPVSPALKGLPLKAGSLPAGRQEGAQYRENALPGSHTLWGVASFVKD